MILRSANLVLLLFGLLSAPVVRAEDQPRASPSLAEVVQPTTSPAPPSLKQLDENLSLIRGNNTPEARKLGATRLLEAGTQDAVARLVSVFSANPADVTAQLAVCQAIADFERPPDALIDPILPLFGDARPNVLDAAALAIRRFDPSLIVGKTRPIAQDATAAPEVRLAAIRALGQLGDDIQAIGVLADLLEDADRTIRTAAFKAFREATGVGDPQAASAWYRSKKTMSQVQWLKAIIEARSQQVARLKTERSDLTRRLVAAYRQTYLDTPEPNRPQYLQSLLADELPAARLLGLDLVNDLITDRKDINAETKSRIVELTVDLSPQVRLKASRMVGDLRLTNAVTKLLEALSREIEDDVRAVQLNALGRLDDLTVLPVLLNHLNDDSLPIVGEAATAIGTLLRRGQQADAAVETAAPQLTDRFRSLPASAEEVREKFLLAMTSMSDPAFRDIFEQEMERSRSLRIRRAAIAGLAGHEDSAAAEAIRPLTAAAEPEIRLVAVDALAKCGSSEADLTTLANLLPADREPEQAIRQHAWDSYLAVAQRLPPDARLRISNEFDRPDDKTAQRRRLEILRSLRNDTLRYESLSREARIDVLERIADAQLELGEYIAASASLEQAMGILVDQSGEVYASLAHRAIAALLQGKEDAAAMKRVGEFFDGQQINGELKDPLPVADIIRERIKSRISGASDATSFVEARNLIDATGPFAVIVGDSFREELDVLREELHNRRNADVDRLLATLATDPEAESKLFQHGRQAVLPKVYQRLLDPPTTTAPSADSETRLVRLARRLAPNWQGFEATDDEPQRRAALKALKEAIDAAKSENGTGVNPT